MKVDKKAGKLKSIALICSAVMLIGVFAGCGPRTGDGGGDNNSNIVYNGDKIYPVQSDDTLEYWMELTGLLSGQVTNFGETPLAQALEEQTGVKIKYIHPQTGQASEQFNILLAGDELPDIVGYAWNNFAGGPDKAIEDEYIYKLNDIFDKYAPNLRKYFDENPDLDKALKTDTGSYYTFPFVRGDEIMTVGNGLIIRQDWLDDLGLEVPETIDEWTNVLKEFKEKKNADAPLTSAGTGIRTPFMAAYDMTNSFYLDNGEVKFGPAQPAYKDFLITFKDWYSKGYLDNNITSNDGIINDANMLSGKSGASMGWVGSGLGKWTQAAASTGVEPYKLAATPFPVLEKGQKPEFGIKDSRLMPQSGVAISTNCVNVELAARFLDFGYSEEGHTLYNFGIEGESFDWVGDYPTYTDLIMKNPNGLTISQALSAYTRASYSGIFVQDRRYLEQYYELDEQKEALLTYNNTNMAEHVMPPITLTVEEGEESTNILNNVTTYVDEMFIKFIKGEESIENFDKYIEQLKSFGIERAVSIRQDALARFYQR